MGEKEKSKKQKFPSEKRGKPAPVVPTKKWGCKAKENPADRQTQDDLIHNGEIPYKDITG